jgi:hypothetical protein
MEKSLNNIQKWCKKLFLQFPFTMDEKKLIPLYILITLHKTRIKHDNFDFKSRIFLDEKTSQVTKNIDQTLIINWTC